jgi:hypothetical protein
MTEDTNTLILKELQKISASLERAEARATGQGRGGGSGYITSYEVGTYGIGGGHFASGDAPDLSSPEWVDKFKNVSA